MQKRIHNGIEEHKHDEFGWHNKDRVHHRSSRRSALKKWAFSRYKKPFDEKCKEDFKERNQKKKLKP